jgi:hypothetical protein
MSIVALESLMLQDCVKAQVENFYGITRVIYYITFTSCPGTVVSAGVTGSAVP